MTTSKRRYESPRRQQQAAATRARLLASARRLFAERGYGATTIEAIASDAGLAVQTFYAVYGSKRSVLFALLDAGDAAADVSGLRERLHSTVDPQQQLRALVEFNIRLYEQIGDLLEILHAAGTTDPDVASLAREGNERRRAGQAALVQEWARRGVLKRGMAASEAADIVWGLTSPDLYQLFVVERRWSGPQYGEWLYTTLAWLLFGAANDAGQNSRVGQGETDRN
jgi:AcrR family transcriptional regulator